MTPNDVPPPPRELTPEELRKVYDHFRKQFTAEDLMEYIEDDAPKITDDVVMTEFDAILAGRDVSSEASP